MKWTPEAPVYVESITANAIKFSSESNEVTAAGNLSGLDLQLGQAVAVTIETASDVAPLTGTLTLTRTIAKGTTDLPWTGSMTVDQDVPPGEYTVVITPKASDKP
jgi:hypothetical protein